MYKYTAGFIGAGNMGGALAEAACRAIDPCKVIVSCKTESHAAEIAGRLGCDSGSAADVVKSSKFVFFGVKPQAFREVADELSSDFGLSECIIVSMLAGVSIDELENVFGTGRKIIRIMPNTPCTVGRGVMLLCKNDCVSEEDLEEFENLMSKSGVIDEIPEKLIDAASAVSGCGPAFAYMFIEALADGGVKCGLPRKNALYYAAHMLMGSAEMALKTKKHPEELKDAVCSPGGSTIEGVHALENGAFRCSVIDAVESVYIKTKELGK